MRRTLSLALAVTLVPVVMADSKPLLRLTFDDPAEPLVARLLADYRIEAVAGAGVHGTTGLRVAYIGFPRGSKRVVHSLPLPTAGEEMTLQYDVLFEQDFPFTRGKLHGFGPADPITGGEPMRPDGWSARLNFSEGGGLKTYLYTQNKSHRYGASVYTGEGFRLENERWYAFTLHVRLNSTPDKADGFARIYVDGELVVRHEDVRYRAETGEDTLIRQFLFSTFHGGSRPEWAPVDENGNFTTVYAAFDNFAVYAGEAIRSAPGQPD